MTYTTGPTMQRRELQTVIDSRRYLTARGAQRIIRATVPDAIVSRVEHMAYEAR